MKDRFKKVLPGTSDALGRCEKIVQVQDSAGAEYGPIIDSN